jgi:hypothetical protein
MDMNFDQLITLTSGLEWFDLPMLVQLSDERRATLTNQLFRWSKSGKVIPLRRGMYALADRYRKVKMQPAALANALYRPSYLSGLWAMAYYGLIPEAVPVFTSVSTRKPRTFKNAFGEFVYRNVKLSLFEGYQVVRILERDVLVATAEKALFDYWYLSTGPWRQSRMAEMRLSNSLIEPQKLHRWIEQSGKPRLYEAFEAWSEGAAQDDEEGIEL